MEDTSTGDLVKDLHGDLTRKYRKHSAIIEQYWRSFDKSQRTKCLKAGAAEGAVLKHSNDQSLGNVYKVIPEINLRDITNPESDFLLDLLKHRATNSLLNQYMSGLNGGLGDHAFTKLMMDTRGLRLSNPDRRGFTLFIDEDQYGQSMTIMRDAPEILAGLQPAIRAHLCVPQELGELILQRQMYMLQHLTILIDDILDIGSTTRDRKERPSKKSDQAAAAALSKLSIQEPSKSLSLPDLIASAADQKARLEEYLTLLSTEPVVLAHDVNISFFSRPELLPDEKGRIMPVVTDKYISASVLDVVYNAVKGVAIWTYIGRLLDLLCSTPSTEKAYRLIILQEISNVCHLEYSRTQAVFKRNVQTANGAKWFKRISNVYDKAGNARVTMNGNPEVLTRSDPQLHYMLRLCQPETDAKKATDWIKKLGDLHQASPSEREKLEEREADSFSDLAIITSFIKDLSPVISLPSLSRKKNQTFVGRSQELDVEMNILKPKIDLQDFVVPIDNLLEPGVAPKALSLLDHLIIENAGTTLGFLYQDLMDECFAEIEKQGQLLKKRTDEKEQGSQVVAPQPQLQPEPRQKVVEQRKQKEKTRPPRPSMFTIVESPEKAEEVLPEEEQGPIFKVRASTAELFSNLFAKSEARGSVTWTAFLSAMAELDFSVQPKFGSVYTFSPPESMNLSKSLTLHRPHKSEIGHYHAILYAKRLQRVYGWNAKTFEVAE